MYTKNAFNPMPGACARGRFASSPIKIVPTIAESAVVTYIASNETPFSAENIPELTIRIYAIARKVVSPATASVFSEDPFAT